MMSIISGGQMPARWFTMARALVTEVVPLVRPQIVERPMKHRGGAVAVRSVGHACGRSNVQIALIERGQ
jgi:hypothetical protein